MTRQLIYRCSVLKLQEGEDFEGCETHDPGYTEIEWRLNQLVHELAGEYMGQYLSFVEREGI